jgi:predicted transcriptional regulator of viral defense system
MENNLKLSTNYIIKSLFEQEYYYFTVRELAGLLKIPIAKAYAIAARLEGRGFIKSVEGGKYLLLGFEPERVLSNPFFIASRIVYPSYVSFWSALNFYGFTEQVPVMVFLASARKKKEVEFNNSRFKYVLINPEKFFGYRKERIGELDFLIAEEEKAVVDSLYLPENAGGVVEVAKAVYNAKDKVDLEKLFAYASAMKNRSLCSRLGYLLERFGTEAGMLLECSSHEYVKLDPARKKSRVWDKRWHVNVNMSEEEISGWRET